jgi:hypothetical protein
MSVWEELTSVQADAVRATAEATRCDTDELAAELEPLLVETPPRTGPPTNPLPVINPQQEAQ